MTKRLNSAPVLRGLKDFQRKTVDYVFRRLYEDDNPARRFLIADEVGLGKTLVARGLIARTIDLLADRKVGRIDVIYICSNADIARQNINRLNVTGGEDFEIASRITLLPIYLKDLKSNRINFVSFTPGTSFDLRSGLGKDVERALLYWLLQKAWKLRGKAPLNVLQGQSGTENFRKLVKSFNRRHDIDQTLGQAFAKALEQHIDKEKQCGKTGLKERFDDLCSRFSRTRIRKRIPRDDLRDQLRLVGELRALLASTCLMALEPDLIILDEFQRFKHLLDGTDRASDLARDLFEFEDARVLLLSATPYKMYTLPHESTIDDHYRDFIRTVRFLQSDANETERFEALLQDYRKRLLRINEGTETQLSSIKSQLESNLRQIIVRTEKLASSDDREGMLKQIQSTTRLSAKDLGDYLSLQKIARVLDQTDTMEYWKTAPYLLNFMEGYKVKESFNHFAEMPEREKKLAKTLEGTGLLLNWKDVRSYKQIDPGNARMRALLEDTVGKGAWRLLWLPPSMPYYELRFPFSTPGLSQFTKRLVFSSWRVAPRVIASVLSYEAERLAIRSFEKRASNTAEARKRRKGLLRFARTEDRLSGMPVLGLLYPCVTLARECDPLKLSSGSGALAGTLALAKARIEELLSMILPVQEIGKPEDEAWYWAASIMLDLKFDRKTSGQWLKEDRPNDIWSTAASTTDSEDGSLWAEHVAEARKLVMDRYQLGNPPSDLSEVLALMALGSPAITALRSLTRISSVGTKTISSEIRSNAVQVAWALRHLFNTPESMAIVRSIPGSSNDQPYWRRVLEYSANGCLQSTLDEYVHILRESLGLLDISAEKSCQRIAETISRSLSLVRSAMGVDRISIDSGRLSIDKARLRAHFAVRFGDEKADDLEDVSRGAQVRESFNSPFWPFVLATTSVGQEGLDFHHYCHAVVHWNLPSNPVDLEQREGRVHRYKGHAVRKNVAQAFSSVTSEVVGDPWSQMFDVAKDTRSEGCSDIVPFWVYQLADGAFIERHVPALPLSSEQGQLLALKRSLVVYRMVFGQSAQEDLTSFLLNHFPESEIRRICDAMRINLEPA